MIFIDSSFLFPACFRCAIKKPAKVSAPKRTYCFCELWLQTDSQKGTVKFPATATAPALTDGEPIVRRALAAVYGNKKTWPYNVMLPYRLFSDQTYKWSVWSICVRQISGKSRSKGILIARNGFRPSFFNYSAVISLLNTRMHLPHFFNSAYNKTAVLIYSSFIICRNHQVVNGKVVRVTYISIYQILALTSSYTCQYPKMQWYYPIHN